MNPDINSSVCLWRENAKLRRKAASRLTDVSQDGIILHRRRLDVRGVPHVRTLHRHTLEPSEGVHTQLLCCAVVHPVSTLVDV